MHRRNLENFIWFLKSTSGDIHLTILFFINYESKDAIQNIIICYKDIAGLNKQKKKIYRLWKS